MRRGCPPPSSSPGASWRGGEGKADLQVETSSILAFCLHFLCLSRNFISLSFFFFFLFVLFWPCSWKAEVPPPWRPGTEPEPEQCQGWILSDNNRSLTHCSPKELCTLSFHHMVCDSHTRTPTGGSGRGQRRGQEGSLGGFSIRNSAAPPPLCLLRVGGGHMRCDGSPNLGGCHSNLLGGEA